MEVEIQPEPDDAERRAIAAALAAAERDQVPAAYTSRWRASALSDLRDDAPAEQPGGDPRVVEP